MFQSAGKVRKQARSIILHLQAVFSSKPNSRIVHKKLMDLYWNGNGWIDALNTGCNLLRGKCRLHCCMPRETVLKWNNPELFKWFPLYAEISVSILLYQTLFHVSKNFNNLQSKTNFKKNWICINISMTAICRHWAKYIAKVSLFCLESNLSVNFFVWLDLGN